MEVTYLRYPADQGFLLHHFMLVRQVHQYGGDSCFLQFGQVGQLPPYRPASPADAQYHGIGGFHFLLS